MLNLQGGGRNRPRWWIPEDFGWSRDGMRFTLPEGEGWGEGEASARATQPLRGRFDAWRASGALWL